MRVYDTYTGGLVELPPPPGPIGIYWCGPTVYQRIHVGNALAVSVIPLWLKRWLEHRGYETTVVVNITDINDKIYDARPGRSAELAEDATRWYIEDTDRLGLGRPDVEPTATQTVPEQIAMIEQLIAGGFAYEVDGDVYYRVASFPDYGRLSHQEAGETEEQEPNPLKDDPRDFALWKANKPGEDTSWNSPWGKGRPGWHIECSAMSEKYLGTSFAIHGGGLDLKFPHHENEIAQSRALGHEFARIWMHNGMLSMLGTEMHKSIGNDVSLHAALDTWGRETLLFFFLTGHWRKPLDYSDETLRRAEKRTKKVSNAFLAFPWRALRRHLQTGANIDELTSLPEVQRYLLEMLVAGSDGTWHPNNRWGPIGPPRHFEVASWTSAELQAAFERSRLGDVYDVQAEETARFEWIRFVQALEKDFNLPEAIRLLQRWAKLGHLGLAFVGFNIFGLASLALGDVEIPEEIRALAMRREAARLDGRWGEADELRDEITARGFEVRDVPSPPGFFLVQNDSES
jgi:cysteinyl-tRNA synthetase